MSEKDEVKASVSQPQPEPTKEPEGPEAEFDLEGISLDEPGAVRSAEPPVAAPCARPAGEPEEQRMAPGPPTDQEPEPPTETRAGAVQLTWIQAALLGVLALAPSLGLLLTGLPGRESIAPQPEKPESEESLPRASGAAKPGPWAQARDQAARGRFRGAITGLEGFLGSEEANLHTGEQIEAWLELSDWHQRIGDSEGAERYARKVVDLRLAITPIAKYFEWGEDLFEDGQGFLRAGQYEEAVERFAQARRHLARFLLQERSMSGASRSKIARAHERIADTLRLQADAGEQIQAAGGSRPTRKEGKRKP